ncbi:acyltransferase domain-containing protein [Cohnella sp. WQ 127256]|uniref:acyltransferase domain-containing protein n=1 Tax=Cohnella sp. WQ 127256 TaxID=2938790 RepID=UPI00211886F4|nr:acyltransferase domain-containing protein [Cohnella sp. WQ 127256]
MNLQQFYEGIQLDTHARQIIDQYQMDDSLYLSYKQHFYNDRQAFFERVKQVEGFRQLFLYLFVKLSVDAYEEYQLRGIEDHIYFDTFSDIQLWCMNCLRDFGEYGIEECHWLQEHVQLRLFKLGRLQFQPYAIDRDVELNSKKISKNQVVLNVHIPAGEPLDLQKVEESFDQASRFFRGINPVFICYSWLLYPKLSDILSSSSNILRFQHIFHVDKVDHDVRDAERFIFNKTLAEPQQYAEHTSLQRNAKAYLMAGNKLGNGYGIKIL